VRASWSAAFKPGEALAPACSDNPDLAHAPVSSVWRKRRALLIINSKSGPNRESLSRVRELVDLSGGAWRYRAMSR
jgi:hypothetical protein